MKKFFKIFLLFFFIVFNGELLSAEFKGNFLQGSFILAKTIPGSKVKIDNKKVLVTSDGYFVFGIGRNRKNDVTIQIIKDQKLEIKK